MANNEVATLLGNLLKDEVIRGISEKAGTEVPQTKTAVKTAMPQIIEALAKNSSSKEGAESLSGALDQHPGSLLGNILGAVGDNNTQTDGAKILEHVFGTGEQAVVSGVASKAGISTNQATGIMNTVAPLIMESLGKTKADQSLNSGDISGLLAGLLGGQSGGSVLTGLLDKDGDGDIKDDLLTMFFRWIMSFFTGKK